MKMTNLDELARIAPGGDPAVLNELFAACRPVLVVHVRRYELWNGDLHTAEDLLQEAFGAATVRVAHASFPDFIYFRAWLKAVVVSICRDRRKYQLRKKRNVHRLGPAAGGAEAPGGAADDGTGPEPAGGRITPAGGWAGAFDQVADGGTSPERAARRHERAELLMKAIGSLDDRYRRVVELRYFEGFAVEETARLLKLKPGTVQTMSYEAKAMLREALGSPDNFLSSRR